jgi:RimJ/RimL family protein N-acetyltransferase
VLIGQQLQIHPRADHLLSTLPHDSNMAPSIVHLPNGHNLSVTPVFGGLAFKSVDAHSHHNIFPPGWTITIESEDDGAPLTPSADGTPTHRVHSYKKPSLQGDHLFISSISNPPNEHTPSHFPASSPTRQIAMMLWATLYWYFHQPEPDNRVTNFTSQGTVEAGRPKGEWRININREGVFRGKQLMQKLERMGLIATEDSAVGTSLDPNPSDGWSSMFVSRRHFWQLDPRIYLFTSSPQVNSALVSRTLLDSRPESPALDISSSKSDFKVDNAGSAVSTGGDHGLWTPPGQFKSTSHMPTFYPPAPAQYIFTDNVRHPIRPKPPRQGETFYTRFIPSLGEYLSFRVASLSKRSVQHIGPLSDPSPVGTADHELSDAELLHKWMNDERVAYSWGEQGPLSHQEEFLKGGLTNKHVIPVIGCFDGKPFGYFEIYWVKEDRLGSYLGYQVSDYDRGVHLLIGEQRFRGPHRVKVWLSALIHYCFLADARTETVMLEPRVDNEK